jgi:hypothetical protein
MHPVKEMNIVKPLYAAIALLVVVACGNFNLPAADSEDSLRPLLKTLEGGPFTITVTPLRGKTRSREEAEKAAKAFLGLDDRSAHAWEVRLTDREFMGELVTKKPCWLLEYTVTIDKAKLPLFVAIDAESGAFVEAFTRAQKPWWEEMKVTNAAVIKHYNAWGERAKLIDKVPRKPLAEILKNFTEVDKDPQFIIRYFSYSNLNRGRGITRIDDAEICPTISNRAVWYISLEGVQSNRPGPAPIVGDKDSSKVPPKEFNAIFDATTGEILSLSSFR